MVSSEAHLVKWNCLTLFRRVSMPTFGTRFRYAGAQEFVLSWTCISQMVLRLFVWRSKPPLVPPAARPDGKMIKIHNDFCAAMVVHPLGKIPTQAQLAAFHERPRKITSPAFFRLVIPDASLIWRWIPTICCFRAGSIRAKEMSLSSNFFAMQCGCPAGTYHEKLPSPWSGAKARKRLPTSFLEDNSIATVPRFVESLITIYRRRNEIAEASLEERGNTKASKPRKKAWTCTSYDYYLSDDK